MSRKFQFSLRKFLLFVAVAAIVIWAGSLLNQFIRAYKRLATEHTG